MSSELTRVQAPPARTYPSLRAAAIPLGALCLAFFVEMVDNTLMSIALPTIGRDLGGGTLSLQWVAAAYSVTFGACCSPPAPPPTGSAGVACCSSASRCSAS